MTPQTVYRLWIIPAAIFLLALGILFWLARQENLQKLEKIPRGRIFGLLAGWFGLFWCIPHAQAVAPAFLLPLMKPLAVIVPIASFFCLDYMTARAVGGLLIIFSYEALHRSFELELPLAGFTAVLSWILGGCGVWISGIPHHFRDAIRLAARGGKWKALLAGVFLFCALYFFLSGVCLI